MNKSGVVTSLLLGLSIFALASCGQNSNAISSPKVKAVVDTVKTPNAETKLDSTANHNVKTIRLGQAEGFAVFAHLGISSVPSSTINGKVGLRPGVRSQILLDPSEIVGGFTDVYAGDDKDLDAAAFVLKAKLDIINAYNDAETRLADEDKIGLFNGNLGNKVLAPGVYEWKSRVTIPLDLKLEGNENDVWIFKVSGQLRIGTDVHMTLSGGAMAKNVFWQVGDDVLIRARSTVVGTIISQQTFEMKEQASLVGRAFAKNDKLVLDKNSITKP